MPSYVESDALIRKTRKNQEVMPKTLAGLAVIALVALAVLGVTFGAVGNWTAVEIVEFVALGASAFLLGAYTGWYRTVTTDMKNNGHQPIKINTAARVMGVIAILAVITLSILGAIFGYVGNETALRVIGYVALGLSAGMVGGFMMHFLKEAEDRSQVATLVAPDAQKYTSSVQVTTGAPSATQVSLVEEARSHNTAAVVDSGAY